MATHTTGIGFFIAATGLLCLALPSNAGAGKIGRGALDAKHVVSHSAKRDTAHGLHGRHSPGGQAHGYGHDKHHGNGHRDHGYRQHDRHSGHGYGHGGHYGEHGRYGHPAHHGYRPYYRPYYYGSGVYLSFGFPALHSHQLGCGHVGYYCDHCHFHTTALQVFYDHVHLSHRVSVTAIPGLLTWNPVNLTFVFD